MLRLFFALTAIILTGSLQGQFFRKSINKLDDNGKRTGWWITYWDEEEKVPMSKARFKNGYETGVSKEYHINGKIRLKFRHHKNNRIRVKYYDENRRLEQKGWAILEYNEKDTHYYWHGAWKFYDKHRKLERIKYYEYGEEVEP